MKVFQGLVLAGKALLALLIVVVVTVAASTYVKSMRLGLETHGVDLNLGRISFLRHCSSCHSVVPDGPQRGFGNLGGLRSLNPLVL